MFDQDHDHHCDKLVSHLILICDQDHVRQRYDCLESCMMFYHVSLWVFLEPTSLISFLLFSVSTIALLFHDLMKFLVVSKFRQFMLIVFHLLV